jgi:hypothetical protein
LYSVFNKYNYRPYCQEIVHKHHHKARLAPILEGSIAFTRKIDEAAGAMFALQNEVLAAQGIPVQGRGREAYRS